MNRQPPISGAASTGQDLDAQIARAERRLVANEAVLARSLDQMVRRASAHKRSILPVAGIVVCVTALIVVWRLQRHPDAPTARRQRD